MTTAAPSALIPHSESVTLTSGETITVGEATFGQIPRISAALMAAIPAGAQEGMTISPADLLANGGDGVLDALAVLIKKPRAFVDALPFDDGLALTTAAMRVNTELFQKKVLPALAQLMAK